MILPRKLMEQQRCAECGKLFPPREEMSKPAPPLPPDILGFPVKKVCTACFWKEKNVTHAKDSKERSHAEPE